jgi:hypothetical protein
MTPARVRPPIRAATAMIQTWLKMRSRRRSTTSASAPAGILRRNMGRLVAVCIKATMMGVGASDVMSHAPATSRIHMPMLETTLAIQKALKTGSRSGFHAEGRVVGSEAIRLKTVSCRGELQEPQRCSIVTYLFKRANNMVARGVRKGRWCLYRGRPCRD